MSNSNVNGAATQQGALAKNSLAVLGVFGSSGDLRALMRLSNGRVEKVEPGSRIGAGATVLAIDETGVMLRQSGQTVRIDIPGS